MQVILWDIDGTLLNFHAAEKKAIVSCFEKFGLGECTEEMLDRYSVINKGYWKRLELGELTKQQVLTGRFREFFETQGLPVELAEAFNEEYLIRLGDTIVFYDRGFELVESLRGTYKQYAVTNGAQVAQERKLRRSGLDRLLDGVFISDEVGIEKPRKEFFDRVFAEIGDYPKDQVIIVGDSLTSDMLGGENAGIVTCWYNPGAQKKSIEVRVDYEIKDLWDLVPLLCSR